MREEIIQKMKESPLTQVNLGNLNIVDSEIEEILTVISKTKQNVEDINLYGNKLGDNGAILISQYCENFKNLASIDVQGNNIGREGLKAICTLLNDNNNLDLALGGNQITDVGEMANIEQEAKTLKKNKPKIK